VKRFSFIESDNTPVLFIAEGQKSRLIALSDDKHPQFKITFGGKQAHRDPENVDAEEFIGKKGYQAKGKKCSSFDVKKVEFIEPLHKPEDDIPEQQEAEQDGNADSGKDSGSNGGTENGGGEEPIDIMLPDKDKPSEIKRLPDIKDLPDEGDIEEPTLF
jgi:hypothetical protein